MPDQALAWAGAVVMAAAVGLGERSWDSMKEAVRSRREARELETGEPFTTDVKLKNLDYIMFTEGDRSEDVPASGHTVQLIVTGALPRPVLLTDLRVEVVARSDQFGVLNRHAGEVPRRRFDVLLDTQPPCVRTRGDSDFPYTIKEHESEAFDLISQSVPRQSR
ncbi:hypothetical protein ABT009_12160 [Streptomyces sp. NPDC002896]|uniref:hypothetical protein n=1 Tax=Streptomyces sp. NPDC002896 TaxID=3154438 RepID=UPI0033216A9A